MKKLVATIAFGALLVAGFSAVQEAPTDNAMELEPRILSIGYDAQQF